MLVDLYDFMTDGVRRGAILRKYDTEAVHTRVVFQPTPTEQPETTPKRQAHPQRQSAPVGRPRPGNRPKPHHSGSSIGEPDEPDVFLVDSVITFSSNVFDWATAEHTIAGQTPVRLRRDGDTVRANGQTVPLSQRAVPTYAEHLVLNQMLTSGVGKQDFAMFNDEDPHTESLAELVNDGVEDVVLDGGVIVPAVRYQLVVDGNRTNTHWVVDSMIIKSDWCGAQSHLVGTERFLTAGIESAEVVSHIHDFLHD